MWNLMSDNDLKKTKGSAQYWLVLVTMATRMHLVVWLVQYEAPSVVNDGLTLNSIEEADLMSNTVFCLFSYCVCDTTMSPWEQRTNKNPSLHRSTACFHYDSLLGWSYSCEFHQVEGWDSLLVFFFASLLFGFCSQYHIQSIYFPFLQGFLSSVSAIWELPPPFVQNKVLFWCLCIPGSEILKSVFSMNNLQLWLDI